VAFATPPDLTHSEAPYCDVVVQIQTHSLVSFIVHFFRLAPAGGNGDFTTPRLSAQFELLYYYISLPQVCMFHEPSIDEHETPLIKGPPLCMPATARVPLYAYVNRRAPLVFKLTQKVFMPYSREIIMVRLPRKRILSRPDELDEDGLAKLRVHLEMDGRGFYIISIADGTLDYPKQPGQVIYIGKATSVTTI